MKCIYVTWSNTVRVIHYSIDLLLDGVSGMLITLTLLGGVEGLTLQQILTILIQLRLDDDALTWLHW